MIPENDAYRQRHFVRQQIETNQNNSSHIRVGSLPVQNYRLRQLSSDSPVAGTSASFNIGRNQSHNVISASQTMPDTNDNSRASSHSSLSSGDISLNNELQQNIAHQRHFTDETENHTLQNASTAFIRRTTSINIGIVGVPSAGIQNDNNMSSSEGKCKTVYVRTSLRDTSKTMEPMTVGQSVSVSERHVNSNVAMTNATSVIHVEGLLTRQPSWPETPPLVSSSAAARSSTRKLILERLKNRNRPLEENMV